VKMLDVRPGSHRGVESALTEGAGMPSLDCTAIGLVVRVCSRRRGEKVPCSTSKKGEEKGKKANENEREGVRGVGTDKNAGP